MNLAPAASVEAESNIPEGYAKLTYSALNVDEIITSVQDNAAGAIAVFMGTTRNTFNKKVVTRLEYQAYSKLAIKTMIDILRAAASRAESTDRPTALVRSTVHHRLGTVPVGEASIVIAVSSPHRKEAFVACEYILEEVKRTAQIWKREYYEGEDESTAEWKSNR